MSQGEGGGSCPVFFFWLCRCLPALFCLLTRPNYACHLHQKDGAKINKLMWVKALGAQQMKGDLISKASNDRRQGGLAPKLTRELVMAPGRGFCELHLSLQQWDWSLPHLPPLSLYSSWVEGKMCAPLCSDWEKEKVQLSSFSWQPSLHEYTVGPAECRGH